MKGLDLDGCTHRQYLMCTRRRRLHSHVFPERRLFKMQGQFRSTGEQKVANHNSRFAINPAGKIEGGREKGKREEQIAFQRHRRPISRQI